MAILGKLLHFEIVQDTCLVAISFFSALCNRHWGKKSELLTTEVKFEYVFSVYNSIILLNIHKSIMCFHKLEYIKQCNFEALAVFLNMIILFVWMTFRHINGTLACLVYLKPRRCCRSLGTEVTLGVTCNMVAGDSTKNLKKNIKYHYCWAISAAKA